MYTIKANNKEYVVSEHALMRMQRRDISEAWVIATLENGDITTQPQGTDLYEYQIDDEAFNVVVIVQVIVNEDQLIIVTVIDDTLPVDETTGDNE